MKTIDKSEYLRVVNKLNMECQMSGYVYADKDWAMDPFYSSGHRLYFITEGTAFMYLNDRKIHLKAGHMYLLPRHLPYGFACDGTMEKFFIHFTLYFSTGFEVFDLLEDHFEMPFDAYMEEKIAFIRENLDYNDEDFWAYNELIWHSFKIILKPMMAEVLSAENRHQPFERLYEYVSKNIRFGLTIDELAGVMNLSKPYLSGKFKKATGYTLKEYVNHRIIQKAKEMLGYTDESLKSIAEDLNFSDVYYFSHFFKRHVEVPPSVYRKNLKS